eukprot:RCo007749
MPCAVGGVWKGVLGALEGRGARPGPGMQTDAKPKWSEGMKALIPSWEALHDQSTGLTLEMAPYCRQVGVVSNINGGTCRVTFRDDKFWRYDLDRLLVPEDSGKAKGTPKVAPLARRARLLLHFRGPQDRNNVWRVANELLRARKMDELQDLQLVPWLRFLLKGLLKLPVWQGKTYRGVSVPLVKISSSYVPQKEVTWTALSSTTVDPAGTMRKFGHGHEGITTTSRWGNLCAA